MDIAGELMAIDRCLRSPAFRPGGMVQKDNGRVGTVMAVRLSISVDGFGNEYKIQWQSGPIEWVDGRYLTSLSENACLPEGRKERCHADP